MLLQLPPPAGGGRARTNGMSDKQRDPAGLRDIRRRPPGRRALAAAARLAASARQGPGAWLWLMSRRASRLVSAAARLAAAASLIVFPLTSSVLRFVSAASLAAPTAVIQF